LIKTLFIAQKHEKTDKMTVFPSITGRGERYKILGNLVMFLSTLVIALVLISISIESIDSTLLVIGKEEERPELFNEIRIIGFDFNKSTLFGLNNFYAVDYVIYEHEASDFLKISVGEYYDSGTWYTENTSNTSYTGEVLPYTLSPELNTSVSEFTVWVMIDTKNVIPSPEHPRSLTFLKMNYTRGSYEYVESHSWNCSYDHTTQLFRTNRTITPWTKYIIASTTQRIGKMSQ